MIVSAKERNKAKRRAAQEVKLPGRRRHFEDVITSTAIEIASCGRRPLPKQPGPRVRGRAGPLISPEEVERRLMRGMKTLRSIPDREARFHRVGNGWPSYIREYMDAYASVEALVPRFKPTPADISDYLTALSWVRHLENHQWKILWWRSFGTSFGMIAKWIGQSDETARRKYRNIMVDVWSAANEV